MTDTIAAATDNSNNNDTTTRTESDDVIISSLAERLSFFFSNANLRQDKWMRGQLASSHDGNSLPLDLLMKFNTVKSITSDKSFLALAAQSDSLKTLITYDGEKEEIRRVVPFDYKTMGDGSRLSLYVKNIPLTEPTTTTTIKEEEKDKEEKEEEEVAAEADKFRPRYAVSREEVQSLFECYGRIAIIQLRYGRKKDEQHQKKNTIVGNEDYEKYTLSSGDTTRGGKGESYPLGVAIVEFDSVEGMENACKDLLISEDTKTTTTTETKDGEEENAVVAVDGGGVDAKEADNEGEEKASSMTTTGGTKVLELKGKKLIVERMRPSKFFLNKKRSREDDDDDDEEENAEEEQDDAKNIEPVAFDWEKGCVIALTGLSTTACDRESIREAVSDILGVTKDVKTSGLYVDYTRGQSTGNIRLNEPKPDEMNDLVAKLCDGSVLIANEKVESAKILEGEEEEQYMKEYFDFLTKMKKMREEENRSQKYKRRFNGGGGRGRGRGGGRGRGRGGGRGRGRR